MPVFLPMILSPSRKRESSFTLDWKSIKDDHGHLAYGIILVFERKPTLQQKNWLMIALNHMFVGRRV